MFERATLFRGALELEHRQRPAGLVVTSGWPHAANPASGIFIQRQVRDLCRLGIRCDVLIVRAQQSRLAYPAAAALLLWWSLTRRRNYGFVHAHGGEVAIAARFYIRAPLVVSYLGGDLLGNVTPAGRVTAAQRLRRLMIRKHACLAKATITKSVEMELALPPTLRRRNHVIPNGVDLDLFRPRDRQEARRGVGWPEDEPVILFAGRRDDPHKRFALAQAAYELVRKEIPDARLLVAEGMPVDRMPFFLSAADCLLLTSHFEGSPNMVKEAAMCNLAVVSTDVGDVRELLAEVVPSAVCEPEPRSLADAIVSALRSGSRSNGRAKLAARLSGDAVAGRVAAVYAEL